MFAINMLILRINLSVSHSLFLFHKLVKPSKRGSKQISLFFSNGLIAGCCFSKQSDVEALLPKSNDGIMDNQIVINTRPQSTIVQQVSNFLKMKRSCNSPDNALSKHAIVKVDQLTETYTKRQKTDDIKNDTNEEAQSVIKITSPANETLDLPKAESVKPEAGADVQKSKKQRPNYFVAIQISDAQINKTLSKLQQHMLEKDERLKKSMIQLATLHITLMVMYIGDTETHAKALKALETIHQEHDDDFSKNPLKLEFKGLSHFQNRVLYAKLSADDSSTRLSLLAESVNKHYAAASIISTDSKKGFTPHLTVAKIRDVGKRKKFLKKIDPLLYKEFNDQYFGSQEVQSIQLLSMTDPKDEVGYYSGKEIYFSAYEPKIKRDYLNKVLETEEKKKDIKEKISALMKEKLK